MQAAQLEMSSLSYQLNGRAISAAEFTAAACNPKHSVVVEACAGSGKTWLLVSRMLRLLLQGAAPNEILAITFTRLAAQEMRERLDSLLRQLALADDGEARQLLLERGVESAQLELYLPKARQLYARLLGSSQNLTIDTFHSWFGRLLKLAPLASGIPHGYELQEQAGDIEKAAYQDFMRLQARDDQRELHQALCLLIDQLGDASCRNLLQAFLARRAEWLVCQSGFFAGTPAQWLQELCGVDAQRDARLEIFSNDNLRRRILAVASILGEGSVANQKNAALLAAAFAGEQDVAAFELAYSGFYDKSAKLRSHSYQTKALKSAVAKHRTDANVEGFRSEVEDLAEQLQILKKRSAEKQVLEINEALFLCGQTLIDCYQRRKQALRVLDFNDLEWLTFRLLQNEELANFLHMRLDARYKHILLDEFQDTNPLQWSIVQSWLAAYSEAQAAPSVFIVGDPKQSIYRFRRAEPRVFAAARDGLAAQGALLLRTSQTRRNANAIVMSLNQAMAANPLYLPQATSSDLPGDVWHLPLIGQKQNDDAEEPDTGALTNPEVEDVQTIELHEDKWQIRNPLQQALEEAENTQRYLEGQQLARALWQLRQRRLSEPQASWSWQQVMLLVRRRTHLSAYEKALREAGIPFVSNRRGGLLETLEILDMIALVNVLLTPADNFSLAHALKSPVFGLTDHELKQLAALARAHQGSWWYGLLSQTENPDVSQAWLRAARLLVSWRDAANELSPHDLLDRIYFQGELILRYAAAVPASQRSQTQGNLEAFLELALNCGGGRYPSLSKFVQELEKLKAGKESESPDESPANSGIDAVQILTIHAAKGLEADIVVLLDANHSEGRADYQGILCHWPVQASEAAHFSAFWKKESRGLARERFFDQEEQLAQQENWNLLYVAATRARQVLLISGVSGKASDSWYQTLQTCSEAWCWEHVDMTQGPAQSSLTRFEIAAYQAQDLLILSEAMVQTQAQQEGVALHNLLERVCQTAKTWPIIIPEPEYIAAWVHIPLALASKVAERARRLFARPELQRFFDAHLYQKARNEMSILFEGELLRLDRVVWFENEIWVIDYKRSLNAGNRHDYHQQLARYRLAIQEIYRGIPVYCCLIAVNSETIDVNFEQNQNLLV